MVQHHPASLQVDFDNAPLAAHVLIFEAPYYKDIADLLAEGARAEFASRGVTFERIVVPGALELPQAFGIAALARANGETRFDGAIALGCVIRGETAHYDIVCNNANHWLMDIAMRHALPFGNAILTVDTHAQAVARAENGRTGKGGDAARACLRLIELKRAMAAAPATGSGR